MMPTLTPLTTTVVVGEKCGWWVAMSRTFTEMTGTPASRMCSMFVM